MEFVNLSCSGEEPVDPVSLAANVFREGALFESVQL